MLEAALVERVHRRATRMLYTLDYDEARAKLWDHGGPVELAVAIESEVGGLRVGEFELGLATYRREGARDAVQADGARRIRRALVQIGARGPSRATYWLGPRGWVHELAPGDRLRVHSERVDEFLRVVLGSPARTPHRAVIALGACFADDVDAFFGTRVRAPIGGEPVRWPLDALETMDECEWLGLAMTPPVAVVSAPSLTRLAEPLASYLSLYPRCELAILDGSLEPPAAIDGSEVVCEHSFLEPRDAGGGTLAIVRHEDGRYALAAMPAYRPGG